MKISYNTRSKTWYHTNLNTLITFGGESTHIPFQMVDQPKSISFDVKLNNSHAGPLIGIITARKTDGGITGNGALFIELQKKLTSLGGFSFIFTPDDAYDHYLNGYAYLPESNTWVSIRVPYPELVYNRIPFRNFEQSMICHRLFEALKQKNIPFFNPCFLDKYELYSIFQQHPDLKRHMPKTELVSDENKFFSFLNEYRHVYLKPARSTKGKGIFRLSYTNETTIQLQGIKRSETYSSSSDFWANWGMELMAKHYLIQEEIQSASFEGKRFDFRILAHAEKEGYKVTGVGIRQAQAQDLTTHVPNGGRILPYGLIQTKEHDKFIEIVVDQVGKALSGHFGFFGEFSIDAGISITGDYYIYEINSKPMSFDEVEIEERRVGALCRLFFELSGYASS